MDSTVFISYARENAPLARELKRDLEEAGHRCWIDTSDLQPGADFEQRIADAIAACYAFVVLVSPTANARPWVARERRMARRHERPLFPALVENCPLPSDLAGLQAAPLVPDYQDGLNRLLAGLPRPVHRGPAVPPPGAESQRDRELAYLRRLELRELQHVDLYTPLAGTAELGIDDHDPLPMLVARPELEHCPFAAPGNRAKARKARRFDDITLAFPTPEIPRAVLLGPPGGGKTTSLWRVAAELATRAREVADAPLPLLVKLGDWNDQRSVEDFVASQILPLDADLERLLSDGRAVLLLDGLNELPTGAWEQKATAVRDWLSRPELALIPVLATCRRDDYGKALSLDLDTIEIHPLSIQRVREFAATYLAAALPEDLPRAEREKRGRSQADIFFWSLAGDETVKTVWKKWKEAGAELQLFFSAKEIPREKPNVWDKTTGGDDRIWQEQVASPRSLVRLARNPYMLVMLLGVYRGSGNIPDNRGALFRWFVETLLEREGLATRDRLQGILKVQADGERLLDAVGRMAWTLSRYGEEAGCAEALTSLPQEDPALLLEPDLFRLALSASLIEPASGYVRFAHQLLQEYFTALGMKAKLEAGELQAAELWPADRWWERSGWEEAAVLLAGLCPEDCSPVVDWLMEAQPEVAGQCLARSGARISEETLERARSAWAPRLIDLDRDPDPAARAAVGRALATEVGGEMLDRRPGAGVYRDAETALWLPDIDWIPVPAGAFIYQDGEQRELAELEIARNPVTNRQYRCFIDDGGYEDDAWWQGLAEHIAVPETPSWFEGNHPRETVSWYEAVAFCRWHSARVGCEIGLPTEIEWEKVARGADGAKYPWGDEYRVGYANIDETGGNVGPNYLQRTTAVGLYPQASSSSGVLDMAGNVWEWCINPYDDQESRSTEGDADRAWSGGSWRNIDDLARADFRYGYNPWNRHHDVGFRLCRRSPIVNN